MAVVMTDVFILHMSKKLLRMNFYTAFQACIKFPIPVFIVLSINHFWVRHITLITVSSVLFSRTVSRYKHVSTFAIVTVEPILQDAVFPTFSLNIVADRTLPVSFAIFNSWYWPVEHIFTGLTYLKMHISTIK
jgi:hypothetical protein